MKLKPLFYYIILPVFLLTVITTLPRAEEIMHWEDCVIEAGQNNPELLSSKEKINQSIANKDIAKSSALPQINSRFDADTHKASGDRTDSFSYSVSGNQLLFDGFKTSNSIKKASVTVKTFNYNYEVTSSNIRLKLRTAFINLLKAQEYLKVTQDISERRKQNLDLVTLRYEGGREHIGSLLTAEADLSQSLYDVSQAKRSIYNSQRRLLKELGRYGQSVIIAAGDFTIKETDKTRPDFEALAETNPLLHELITKKEAARYNLNAARGEYFPHIYAGGNTGASDSKWPPEDNSWSVGISASLPIFEGGLRIADVKKAGSELNQSAADEKSGKDSIIFTPVDTWTKLQDTVENVEVQYKYLYATQERAKIAESQYSNGLLSFDNWIIIEDNLANAKKRYLESQVNALLAEANWIQARGETLDYDIENKN